MAAITVTAIDLGSDAKTEFVRFGGVVALGDAVYLDTSSSNKWKAADANVSAITAGRDGIGIAMHAVSADGRYGVIVREGTVYIGTLGAAAAGATFIVGAAAAGDIAPDSDGASGWFKTTLGIGGTEGSSDTMDEFIMRPNVSNQAIA